MLAKKKSRKDKRTSSRILKQAGIAQSERKWLEFNNLLPVSLFVLFGLLLIFICFVGLSPASQPILRGQVARIRVVSEFQFFYNSDILTTRSIEEERRKVPPVFSLEFESLNRFRSYVDTLNGSLDKLLLEENTTGEEGIEAGQVLAADGTEKQTLQQKVRGLLQNDPMKQVYKISPEDLALITERLSPDERRDWFEEGLVILEGVSRVGIYDPESNAVGQSLNPETFNQVIFDSNITPAQIQPLEEAVRTLRINVSALDIPREISVALFRILRTGLAPNLVFDKTKTEAVIANRLAKLPPVRVEVEAGETIIQPGNKVTALVYEKLSAYKKKRAEMETTGITESILVERIVLTCVIMLTIVLFLKIGNISLGRNYRRMILCGVLILVNLVLIRLLIEWSNAEYISERSTSLPAIIPYLAPTVLSPLIICIIIGAGPGIFVAAIISVFTSLMYGNSIPTLVVTFLASVVAIHSCYDIQLRTRLVKAGTLAGLTVAIAAGFLGFREGLDEKIIGYQMLAALVTGIITGSAAVGLLPFLESIFKYTTNITLLELTDFNHPLLRQMQVKAPGSYHHSLMVANLSENAAATIGANTLVCRVCSLFHDIGKMLKPEYYTENQSSGVNPHLTQNPSMSALIIKSHVKEGVNLATEYKLPKIIIDVIKQHHGTTLIKYFYFEALKRQKQNTPPHFANMPKVRLDSVNESTYRYEGPKPQFKESAIIFLADSVEAASRSLKKVTPQSIEDLIDSLFEARFQDDQLSDCPLNFDEIDKIKKSFIRSCLNMLHSRVEYPKKSDMDKLEGENK